MIYPTNSPKLPPPLMLAMLLSLAAGVPSLAAVERYKSEADFLARVSALGYGTVSEGFESSDWDNVRSNYPVINSLPSVTSQGVTWEAAGLDLWDYPTSRIHGVTTNNNWARTGNWGIYEDHVGDPVPTTIRVSSPTSIYGIGGWFDTNPDGQSVGFLIEGRLTANEPGYVLPGFGAMYPGDNPSFGHAFVGIVDPDGFNSVVLTGTLEVNEDNQLEGGVYFGADDFLLVVPALPGDYNLDGTVDAADYVMWRKTGGSPDEYNDWRENFGRTLFTGSGSSVAAEPAVPEPAPVLLLVFGAAVMCLSVRQFREEFQ